MDEAKKEARRRELAEIKGPWDFERVEGAVSVHNQLPVPEVSRHPIPEVKATVDAAAVPLADVNDHAAMPTSLPAIDELQSALKMDSADADQEAVGDPAEAAAEPALPDEHLDPVAYRAAEIVHDERLEARRERRRSKAEAKNARRKARADAAKEKQKPKSKKVTAPAPQVQATAMAISKDGDATLHERVSDKDLGDESDADVASSPSPMSARPAASPAAGSDLWLLALVVGVVAATVFFSVLFR